MSFTYGIIYAFIGAMVIPFGSKNNDSILAIVESTFHRRLRSDYFICISVDLKQLQINSEILNNSSIGKYPQECFYN